MRIRASDELHGRRGLELRLERPGAGAGIVDPEDVEDGRDAFASEKQELRARTGEDRPEEVRLRAGQGEEARENQPVDAGKSSGRQPPAAARRREARVDNPRASSVA